MQQGSDGHCILGTPLCSSGQIITDRILTFSSFQFSSNLELRVLVQSFVSKLEPIAFCFFAYFSTTCNSFCAFLQQELWPLCTV